MVGAQGVQGRFLGMPTARRYFLQFRSTTFAVRPAQYGELLLLVQPLQLLIPASLYVIFHSRITENAHVGG